MQDTLDNEGRIRLTGVHSCRNYNCSSNSYIFWSRAEVRNDRHLAIIERQRLTHDGLADAVLALGLAKTLQELAAIRVRVRIAVTQVTLIVAIFEVDRKTETIMAAATLLLDRVLIIADVGTFAGPADALRTILGLLLGVDERLEALIETGVRLQHVHDVELVVDALAHIGHSEVVPLSVRCRIIVIAQVQIVFIFADLLGASEVARFEARLKDQRRVVLALLRVVRLELAVVAVQLHDLGVEVGLLAGRTVRIILAIDRVLLLSDLDSVILVNVRSSVSIGRVLLGLRRVLNAVVHYSIVGSDAAIITSLSFNARELFDDGRRVDGTDRLVSVTQIVEARPRHHERVFDAGTRKLDWLRSIIFGSRLLLPGESLLLLRWRL